MALSWWSRWSMGSRAAHLLNNGGDTRPTSFGNSLPKNKNLGLQKSFLWCNASLINLCARLLNDVAFFFKRSVIPWIIWHHRNDLGFNNLQWPIEKTRQVIWDAVHDYGRIEWNHTLEDLEKTQDMAYQDVLNECNFTWGQGSYCDLEQLSCHLEG